MNDDDELPNRSRNSPQASNAENMKDSKSFEKIQKQNSTEMMQGVGGAFDAD
jgi:hypothetical protein